MTAQGDNRPGELHLFAGRVEEDWIDYNGHMTEFRYLYVFGETTDRFLEHVGIDLRLASQGTYYTLESHVRHLKETLQGRAFTTHTDLLGYDEKRIHLLHKFVVDGHVHATGEHLCLHVIASRPCAAEGAVLDRLSGLFDAQRHHPVPARCGSVLTKALRYSRPAITEDFHLRSEVVQS